MEGGGDGTRPSFPAVPVAASQSPRADSPQSQGITNPFCKESASYPNNPAKSNTSIRQIRFPRQWLAGSSQPTKDESSKTELLFPISPLGLTISLRRRAPK